MNCMLNVCNKLINLNISSFDTKNVTDMSNMFNGCSSLVNLDLSSFDTKNVINMLCMFFNCDKLKILKLNKILGSNIKLEIDKDFIKPKIIYC